MRTHLRRALHLAARGRFRASPNPLVGAVLVRGDRVVGEGWHDAVGGPHAEVMALADAGESSRGATLYLNLEPCSHHGRTPPCADALVRAGIERVVACHGDPDPRVAGSGFGKLRAAGIAVETGLLVEEAVKLNQAFLTSHLLGRPAVTLKWAMSLDGKIATASGESQWISSPAGRKWALALRETHDAILVGSGTLLADDPRLDRRQAKASGPILRVVIDRRLRFPENARMLDVEGPVRIYTETRNQEKREALEARGAVVLELPEVTPSTVLSDLQRQEIRSLLVEGGGEALASFMEAGLFDRVEVCCAPILIGGKGAAGPLAGAGISQLENAARLEDLAIGTRGVDRILSGRREGSIDELVRRLPSSA